MEHEQNITPAEEPGTGAAAADKEKVTLAIDPGDIDPELDPDSPEFDLYKWQAATGVTDFSKAPEKVRAKFAEERNRLIQSLTEKIDTGEFAKSISESIAQLSQQALTAVNTADLVAAAIASINKAVTNNVSVLYQALYHSDSWKTLKASLISFSEKLADNDYYKEFEQLEPYIIEELKNPEYGGRTLEDLSGAIGVDENGNPTEEGLLWDRAIAAARLAKTIADSLPQLQSTGTPKYYSSPNTTLANALLGNTEKGELIGAGAVDLPVLSVGKDKEVTIYVDATIENTEGITLTGKPYTEYDRAVHDTVVSIYEDRLKTGDPAVFTSDMVYRTMTHKTNAEYVSPQQRAAVTKSINKMATNIRVHADYTAEMKRRGIKANGKPVDSFVIKDFLLPAKEVNISAGGKQVTAYLLRDEPILLTHAKHNGQLITVNGKLLDIQEIDANGNLTGVSLTNNDSRISIKSYLLRRVEVMRNDEKRAADALRKYEARRKKDPTMPLKKIHDFRNQSRVILFSSLFESTGITNKNTQTNSRAYIEQVLRYWQAIRSIKGYKKRKKGKSFDAIIIEF